MLGVWLVNEWAKAGQPEPLQLVELGPGRGTLASDVLRVFRRFGLIGPDFSVELVEVRSSGPSQPILTHPNPS